MPTAILNASQYKQFQTNGVVPEYHVNGQQIPTYAFGGSNTGFSAGKNWKLFPETIAYSDLWYLYKRCDIACNAVDIIPQTLWGKGWNIIIHDDAGKELQDSPLEKQVNQLNKSVNVQGYFEEAHRYARALGLGIVVMGLADNKNLNEPVDKATGLSYISVFSNDEISAINYVVDPKNKDYGKIESYEVIVGGNTENKFTVHRSRVIHLNEKTVKKDARGISVLESPYDLFQILKNTDWAAGEAYYQNASPLYSLSWDDTNAIDATGNPTEPTSAEKQQIKGDLEDLHVKKRFLKPKSWELQVVQGSGHIADPQVIWTPLIERIAGAVGTPKQLLLGTSAGALASGEVNLEQWYGYIANKQSGWAQPLLNEFYSKLQEYGVLEPGNITVEWATLWEMDKKEEADIQLIKVNAAVAAVGAPSALGVSGTAIMSVEEARTQILGLSPKLGSGTQYQTNAPIQANHVEFTTKLNALITKAKDGDLTPEECITKAQPIIDDFAMKREADAIQYLANKTKQQVKKLPAEMMNALKKQSMSYMTDFKKILDDAVGA